MVEGFFLFYVGRISRVVLISLVSVLISLTMCGGRYVVLYPFIFLGS